MNNQRRKDIDAALKLVADARAAIDALREAIEPIKEEEQEYYDNMPESLQGGEKGEAAQAAIDALENAMSDLEGIDLDAIEGALEEAKG